MATTPDPTNPELATTGAMKADPTGVAKAGTGAGPIAPPSSEPEKDPQAMEQTTPKAAGISEEAFFVERQKFWFFWGNFVTTAVAGIAIILLLLAWFLL